MLSNKLMVAPGGLRWCPAGQPTLPWVGGGEPVPSARGRYIFLRTNRFGFDLRPQGVRWVAAGSVSEDT
jgi:hypothetical protein